MQIYCVKNKASKFYMQDPQNPEEKRENADSRAQEQA